MNYNELEIRELEEELRSAYIRRGREEKAIEAITSTLARKKAEEIKNLGVPQAFPA